MTPFVSSTVTTILWHCLYNGDQYACNSSFHKTYLWLALNCCHVQLKSFGDWVGGSLSVVIILYTVSVRLLSKALVICFLMIYVDNLMSSSLLLIIFYWFFYCQNVDVHRFRIFNCYLLHSDFFTKETGLLRSTHFLKLVFQSIFA